MAREIARRDFLKAAAAAGAAAFGTLAAGGRTPQGDPFAGGVMVGTRPLFGRGAATNPLETMIGSGLDARFLTDLSTLTADTLITPVERFYVRTARPDRLDLTRPWRLTIGGLVRRPVALSLADLENDVVDTGTHLLECAGNNNPRNFGLMSAARWSGVPVTRVLERAPAPRRLARVLVSGFDQHSHPSRTSIPGASWIFTVEEIERFGAFLATRMNGAPLTNDHGFPLRLVVPRWYGCACIKWVDAVAFVPDDARATSQMREFAARTFQHGIPERAREFAPPVMDHAAMPVRVEKWVVDGRILYRIVGIVWGGATPTDALAIRFKVGEGYIRVTSCPLPASTTTWSLWWHAWRPPARGRYDIALKIDDARIPTPRLDAYFYSRAVEVDEI